MLVVKQKKQLKASRPATTYERLVIMYGSRACVLCVGCWAIIS